MTRVVRVAKLPDLNGNPPHYGGLFGEEVEALMKAFRISDATAVELAKGGFTTFYDLANMCGLDGFVLYQGSVLGEFVKCAENSAQSQALTLMLTRFGYLIREGGGFDLEAPGAIYDVDLPKLAEVTTAYNARESGIVGQGGELGGGLIPNPQVGTTSKKTAKKGISRSATEKGKGRAEAAPSSSGTGGSAEPEPSSSGVEGGIGGMGTKRKRGGDNGSSGSSSSSDTESGGATDDDKV